MKASLTAVGINVALKAAVLLFHHTRAGRPRARDLDRRLAQSGPCRLFRRAPRPPRIRFRPAERNRKARRGRCRARGGALAVASSGRSAVCRLDVLARREHAGNARRDRRRGLRRNDSRAIWQAMAGGAAGGENARLRAAAAARSISGDARAPAAPARARAVRRCAAPRALDGAPDLVAGENADEVICTGDRDPVERHDVAESISARSADSRPDADDLTALSWVRPAACRRRRESANCWAATPI